MQLRPGTADDFAAIVRLLEAASLNASDLNPAQTSAFLLLCDADTVLACGAVEPFADGAGLVRSVAVHPAHRGKGHATRIMRSLEKHARHRGIQQLYLLTQTAAGFFSRLHYERCERTLAPAAMQKSPQFASLCPSTAVCMRKELRAEA
ncbi:MAG: GNAT family N-acetyltransferase [Opitutaceae bacterium]|nr:GNAT family N-acetyltransferase [Opitutaceae bacterium]